MKERFAMAGEMKKTLVGMFFSRALDSALISFINVWIIWTDLKGYQIPRIAIKILPEEDQSTPRTKIG